MITIALSGGLGNQMFQYAAASALAWRLNTDVCLDITFFIANHQRSWIRDFELNVFKHSALKVQSEIDLKIKYGWKIMPKICRHEWGQKILLSVGLFRDRSSYIFDERTINLKDGITLMGYFQSEKYFDKYRERLLEDFTLKELPDDKNLSMKNRMAEANSVSVHIRRGDYISNLNASKIFAQCTERYYRDALEYIGNNVETPVFYFFSDDIPWVKEQFKDISSAVFVDINQGQHSYLDMWLMSNCKHNIIANSSFSWWGAWLNRNPNKKVIAPREWFKDKMANDSIPDLIPRQWHRL